MHFHENHEVEKDLQIVILENGISKTPAREFAENKWICRLQTLQPAGLNAEMGHYGKEMYSCYTKVLQS